MSSPTGKRILRIVMVIVGAAAIIAAGVYLYIPKDSAGYDTRVRKVADAAAHYTQEQAAQIAGTSGAAVNEGVNSGCVVERLHEIFAMNNIVSCKHKHFVYFLGGGDKRAEIKKLHESAESQGWKISDGSASRYEGFLTDDTYSGFPLLHQRDDRPASSAYLALDLNIIDLKEKDSIFYTDPPYQEMIRQHVTAGTYLYGYTIEDIYYTSSCPVFICRTSPES